MTAATTSRVPCAAYAGTLPPPGPNPSGPAPAATDPAGLSSPRRTGRPANPAEEVTACRTSPTPRTPTGTSSEADPTGSLTPATVTAAEQVTH